MFAALIVLSGCAALDNESSVSSGPVAQITEDSTDTTDPIGSGGAEETDGSVAAPSTDKTEASPEIVDEPQRAVLGVIRPLTGPEMTLSPRNPEGGWGHLSVHRVTAADELAGRSPADGHRLVAVDYHLIAMTGGIIARENLSTATTFRVRVGASVFPPIGPDTIRVMQEGRTVNGQLLFELPDSTEVAVLEGGVEDPLASGFQAQVEMDLGGDTPVPPMLARRDAQEAVMISAAEPPSGSTPGCARCRADLAVADARLTPKIEQVAAREGYVFLQATVELNVTQTERFFDAFTADNIRLQVGDQWIPAIETVVETYGEGERGRWPLTFEVPADVEQARLAFGPHEPHVESEAATAYVEITFPSSP